MKTIQILVLIAACTCGLLADSPSASGAGKAGSPIKNFNLMNLTIPGYIDFCKAMIKFSEDDKVSFAKESKTMLIRMLGWENRRDEQKIFDIDPMFNRSLIFCLVANQNKIKMDKEDMENFKNDCVNTAKKMTDESGQVIIAKIYGLVLAMNEKLPERSAP